MKKTLITLSFLAFAGTALAAESTSDCKNQIIESNIVTMCLHKGGAFQHDRYSLSLNNNLIFYVVDDYVESIRLVHTVPEGPSIEFSLSRQEGHPTVDITGGCLPVSKDQIEVARKCNFSWGKHQVIKNVWFEFPNDDDAVRKQCLAGQQLAIEKKNTEALPMLDTCIRATNSNDLLRRQALIQRAWVRYTLKNFEQATTDQEATFTISPAQSHAELINAAYYLRAVNKIQKGLDFLYQAELFDKLNNTVGMMTQYHIGWNLQLLGQYEEAIKVLTNAIPAQPEFPFVYFRRGLAYEGLGDKAAAKTDFENVHKLMKINSFGGRGQDGMAEIVKKLAEYEISLDDIK